MPLKNPKKHVGGPGKPLQQKISTDLKPGFPALEQADLAKTKYEIDQDDEILALEAIFGDDFQRVDVEGAGVWKKRQPCFKIHIRSSDELHSVVLQVQLTATYPKSIPLLSVSEDEDLREMTRRKIKTIIETKPKELISAGPIIYDLICLIVSVLDDASDADATTLPSLEAERAVREQEAAELARANEAEEQERKELETKEEQRVMDEMVQGEMKRRAKATEGKRRDRRSSVTAENATDLSEKVLSQRVTFDNRIKMIDSENNPIQFSSVTGKSQIRKGPVATVSTVRPIVMGSGIIPILVLKQSELAETTAKTQIHELETELEKLKKIRHRNILDLYDFKVHKTGSESETSGSMQSPPYTISILMEYANKGSLEEVLEVAGDLPITKVRAWTIDLVEGLAYLHHNNIVHQDVQAANVLLVRNQYGEITAKLADCGYQRKLHVLGNRKHGNPSIFSVAKTAYWRPSEHLNSPIPLYTQKTDVWDFGVVFLNMIFGMDLVEKYTSPANLVETVDLSDALYEFVQKIFKQDSQKRPRAAELAFCEFLATDAEVLAKETSASNARLSEPSIGPNTPFRPRHNSVTHKSSGNLLASRYREDFVEESRLGKGGFGVVMKVRKKLDGQFYAVKKIVQKRSSNTLTELLKEVRLLSLLSHPYVVRYYNTWTEELGDEKANEKAISSGDEDDEEAIIFGEDSDGKTLSDDESASSQASDDLNELTGDLDHMSSKVEFEYETDDDEDDEDSKQSTNEKNGHPPKDLPVKKSRSSSRLGKSTRTILYIQMEFCARRTLADLIRDNLNKQKDEVWRLIRQILEALVYIHEMSVVHRDLKPENVFMDDKENIRIGDFGLATSGQFSSGEKNSASAIYSGQADMTQSIGTASYAAPEVRSSAGGVYSAKVDMYSAGIIFFEMCYPPIVGMERAMKIGRLRQAEPKLPDDFDVSVKKVEADIILSLVKHNPKDRPSAYELVHSGKLPEPMEEETIRQTVAKLSNADSESYKHIVNALFSMPTKPARDFAWDMNSATQTQVNELVLQSIVKERLTLIFRNHGALESKRSLLFPLSGLYSAKPVRLLDPSGLVMQLPYDLTLPNARALAKQKPAMLRSFTFGDVYRSAGHIGGQPRAVPEADFDIVSHDTLDLAMKEAEVIKVIDEIIERFPSLDHSKFSFRLNNTDLLHLIFQFCRIDSSTYDAVAEILSRVTECPWSKIRADLRGPLIGMSSTSVTDLQQFNFKDSPQEAFQKLKDIFQGSEVLEKASSAIGHLNDVVTYLDRFQVKTRYLISPLACMNQKFYKGGIMFQCMNETRKKEFVFAAGGRYDSLIREYRGQATGKSRSCHAVGFNIAWQKISTSIATLQQATGKAYLKKQEELSGIWTMKRCDVLVACFDPSLLRVEGTQIVAKLWDQGISAELAVDARSPEDLQAKYGKDSHCWIVVVKQESNLKVKSLIRKEQADTDIPTSQVLTYLLGEIRERDENYGTYEKSRSNRHGSHAEPSTTNTRDQDVSVLIAETRSKKINRSQLVEQAQGKAASLAQSFLDGPIAAIETTDKVLNMVRETRLSDLDSWRQVFQNAPMSERNYLKKLLELLQEFAAEPKTSRNAFIYNFRTGTCIYYDLGADSHQNVKLGRDKD